MAKIITYENPFDEEIANCPASLNFGEQRNLIMDVIVRNYDKMTFFRAVQTEDDDSKDRIRIFFFEIFNRMYVWNEVIENGLLESGQLDKVMRDDFSVALVLYSNIVNIKPFAPIAYKLLNDGMLYHVQTNLEK